MHHKYLYGSLSKEELFFMSNNFDKDDDGMIAVDEEGLKSAKNSVSDEEWLKVQTLVHVLETALENEGGGPISLSMS